ncbi:hypothetical protein [Salinimicrobium marinum]|nr:hypothetical protein [Salinimicrobium marinum]
MCNISHKAIKKHFLYLAIFMNVKPYIAVFFAFLFFGKFLVMDSKILVAILDANEIAYVNPLCKKQHTKNAETDHKSFSQDSDRLNITIDSFCNTPFQFEIYNWEQKIIPEESREYAYHTPPLPESVQERFYPPPKV